MTRRAVLVEIPQPLLAAGQDAKSFLDTLAIPGLQVDSAFEAVPMSSGPQSTVIIRATITSEKAVDRLCRRCADIKIWNDAPVAPMK